MSFDNLEFDNLVFEIETQRRPVASIPPVTEETGAMGREFESRQGMV
jgi:hypothetical protein